MVNYAYSFDPTPTYPADFTDFPDYLQGNIKFVNDGVSLIAGDGSQQFQGYMSARYELNTMTKVSAKELWDIFTFDVNAFVSIHIYAPPNDDRTVGVIYSCVALRPNDSRGSIGSFQYFWNSQYVELTRMVEI